MLFLKKWRVSDSQKVILWKYDIISAYKETTFVDTIDRVLRQEAKWYSYTSNLLKTLPLFVRIQFCEGDIFWKKFFEIEFDVFM